MFVINNDFFFNHWLRCKSVVTLLRNDNDVKVGWLPFYIARKCSFNEYPCRASDFSTPNFYSKQLRQVMPRYPSPFCYLVILCPRHAKKWYRERLSDALFASLKSPPESLPLGGRTAARLRGIMSTARLWFQHFFALAGLRQTDQEGLLEEKFCFEFKTY